MMCTHSLTHSLPPFQLPSSREIDYTQLPHLQVRDVLDAVLSTS